MPVQNCRLVVTADLADPARKILEDAFVEYNFTPNLNARAGQFVPPSGFEAQQIVYDRRFTDLSVVHPWSMAGEPRDIGMMVGADLEAVSLAIAVFNGAGRNAASDNNRWKDVSGRVLVRPIRHELLEFAVRGYNGRLGEEGLPFWNAAGEARYRAGRSEVVAEIQHAMGRTPKRAWYLQASHRFRELLEPAVRLSMEDLTAGYFGIGTVAGLNAYPLGPSLKLMIDAHYWRWFSPNPAQRSTEQRFSVALWTRF